MLPWEVRAMRRAAEAWRISGDGLIPVLAVTAACFLLGGLVVWKHRANIQRLLAGNENKLSFHKKKA